jgi:hypothetical protein
MRETERDAYRIYSLFLGLVGPRPLKGKPNGLGGGKKKGKLIMFNHL